jgi:hypothetical protein
MAAQKQRERYVTNRTWSDQNIQPRSHVNFVRLKCKEYNQESRKTELEVLRININVAGVQQSARGLT